MPSGQDVVNSARRFYGEPYSTAGGRCSQTSGFKDCSGLVSAALSGLGIFNACGTSTSIELWATRNGGSYVSREFANTVPGVGLAIWGYGSGGHIGISMGNNMQIETPSAQGHRVGYSPMGHDRWGEYFTFPGVSYGGEEPGPPAARPNPGVKGMMLKESTSNKVWLVGPGSCTWVVDMDSFNKLKYVGVPYAGEANPLSIVQWAKIFGATEIDGQPI